MPSRSTLPLAAVASAALALPAATAAGAPGAPAAPGAGPLAPDLPGPHATVAAQMRAAARPPLVDRVVRLARLRARLDGHRLRPGYHHAVATWAPRRLRGERHALRRDIRRLRAEHRRGRAATAGGGPAGGGSVASAGLQAIAACESGGNPSAVDATGTYRGKYQFDVQTWRAVGGTGDPAAAPEAEQDRRAAALLARAGANPWPVCGG
jgi:hypothetical protein